MSGSLPAPQAHLAAASERSGLDSDTKCITTSCCVGIDVREYMNTLALVYLLDVQGISSR